MSPLDLRWQHCSIPRCRRLAPQQRVPLGKQLQVFKRFGIQREREREREGGREGEREGGREREREGGRERWWR